MKVKTLLIFVLLSMVTVVFLSYPAYAETGSISISNSLNFLGYTPGAGGTLGDTFMWDTFNFDITDYNTVSSFYVITDTDTVYKLVSNSTYFTCKSGCTGNGFVMYNKLGKIIDWEFASGFTVTAHPFNLTYEINIFDSNNFDMTPATESGNNGAITSSHPMFIRTAGARQAEKLKDGVTSIASDNVVIGTSTTNFYNFTYPIPNNFQGKVTKGNIATRVKVESQSSSYFDEGSTTLNNITMGDVLTNGIYLNVSLTLGNYTKVLINSSGITAAPTPTPIGGGGSSSGQIYFDYTNATPGAVYGINVSTTDANFSSFDTYYIDVFDPTNLEITGFPASFGTQNYSTGRFYYFNKFGTYTANLSYCSFINPLCPSIISPTFLDTASLTVNQIAYNYNISTDKPNYQQGDTIYINATNPGLTNTYVTATGTTGIITELAWNAQVAPNSIRVIVGTIPNTLPLGTYFVSLAGSQGYNPILAQARFNITANTPDNVLGLGWNDYLYTIGGTGILTYKSNINQSQITIYKQGNSNEGLVAVKTFFAPAGNITGNYSQVFNSPGNWYAYIVDTVDTTNFKWANTSVLNPNPSDPNAQGFCKSKESYVCWDKSEYYQGDSYIINYKLVVPSVITYYPTIKIYDPSDSVVKTVKLNYSIWNNTITGAISGKFSTSAKTGVWFVKAEKINQVTGEDNGEIANSAASVIGRNVSAGATPPSGDAAVAGAGNNLRTLISQPFFWGLVILALILYGIRHTQVVKEVAIFVIFVEDVMGLFAPYTIFILIGLIIYAAISFRSGKQIVTGE